jgi:hypothetical protein
MWLRILLFLLGWLTGNAVRSAESVDLLTISAGAVLIAGVIEETAKRFRGERR